MMEGIPSQAELALIRMVRKEVDLLRQRSQATRIYIERLYRDGKLEGKDYHALMARLFDGADRM